jgi:hypothetical protein
LNTNHNQKNLFMIPLIFGAVALGTAAFGALAGAAGMEDMHEAKEIGERAQELYEDAVNECQASLENTNYVAAEYDQLRRNVKSRTIARFVDFIKQNIGQQASQKDIEFLTKIGIPIQQLKKYEAVAQEAGQVFQVGAKAVIDGAKASGAAVGLATSLATCVGAASTGTAISSLSGAAATNATLAWFGGGSLAAGGGGMALGSLVLGGITVGPALMIGGFVLAGQGEEALTKARKYEAKVNTEIATIDAGIAFLQRVERRVNELADLVYDLNAYASRSLSDLESRSFNRERDISKFQQVGLLVRALVEIMEIPVFDSQGQLNPATATVLAKYRNLAGS